MSQLRQMLREVVISGTGKRAAVNGYSIAGKTGTAWKFDEKLKRVNSAKYMSSFIGFTPADDPQVTIAVIIDEPRVGGRDGGQVAAPVFSKIAEEILPELNIKPDLGIETLVAENTEEANESPADEIFSGPVSEETVVEKKAATVKSDTAGSEPRKQLEKSDLKVEKRTVNTDVGTKPERSAPSDRPRVISKPEKVPEVKRKT